MSNKLFSLPFSKFLTGFSIGLSISLGGVAIAESIQVTALPVHFVVDGVDKTPLNQTYNNNGTYVPASLSYDGETYIPLQFASNLLHIPITWDSTSKTIRMGKTPTKYLSDIIPSYFNNGLGDGLLQNNGLHYKKGVTPVYYSMSLSGKSYDKAIMIVTGRPVTIKYTLNKEFGKLSFIYGLDDNNKHQGEYISISGDGKELWEATISPRDLSKEASVNVSGVNELEITGSIADTPANDALYGNYTVLANPVLEKVEQAR